MQLQKRKKQKVDNQFKVQKLTSQFDQAKWCIVRYGLGSTFGCCGNSKVVDIYDVPRQKAPEGALDKCFEIVKMAYANCSLRDDEKIRFAYDMLGKIEDQLTQDYAAQMCAEINKKYTDRFVDKDYWDNTRKANEIMNDSETKESGNESK